MKKIGFVYKYSKKEGKGILVFGNWKDKNPMYNGSKVSPVLFSDTDLLSDVRSGQLAYFDLDDKTVNNIERASLTNFKADFIDSLVRCKENESEFLFYQRNTLISFENLDDIIIPDETDQKSVSSENVDDFSLDDFLDEYMGTSDSSVPSNQNTAASPEIDKPAANLPESVMELYKCFGKYKHKGNRARANRAKANINIDVFDLPLWIDGNVPDGRYYGRSVKEIENLYELFVLKKRYNRRGDAIYNTQSNDCISSCWPLLLSKFSDNDLCQILKVAPKLQPAFPEEFCRMNLDLLTDEYGMPNVEICEMYCQGKALTAKTISEYKDLKHKLYVYSNCNATHLEGEGTPMCRMGRDIISNVERLLKEQYENVIRKGVTTKLTEFCDDPEVSVMLQSATTDEFNSVGLFLEKCERLKSHFFEYKVCKKLVESYEGLQQPYRDAFRSSLIKWVNESAISAVKDDDATPFELSCHVEQLGDLVTESTKQHIKELVNSRFSNLDDPDDLNRAFGDGYISEVQYLLRYKQLTCNYEACQFLSELAVYKNCKFPLDVQWYIVSSAINLLGYEDLKSFKYVELPFGESVSNIRTLLKWLRQQETCDRIDEVTLTKAEEKICSGLSDEERRILSEEKAEEENKSKFRNVHIDSIPERDESTYDRYNGSYAQDEMGYSDDDIDTIFDGDPDAYWNID